MTNDGQRDPSLADEVYNQLLSDITDGTYPLKARLPPEEMLAKNCGVSRPVLRTALARLRDDGMIASRRGSGNYVVRRPAESVKKFVPLASIADIQRCYEFRADVESAAAGWAARRRDKDDLIALENAHEQMDATYQKHALGVDADHLLHLSIARATKNLFYVNVLESMAEQITFGMQLSRSLTLQGAPERQAFVQAEHRRIIDAIRAGSAEQASDAMRLHITAARDRMLVGDSNI